MFYRFGHNVSRHPQFILESRIGISPLPFKKSKDHFTSSHDLIADLCYKRSTVFLEPIKIVFVTSEHPQRDIRDVKQFSKFFGTRQVFY